MRSPTWKSTVWLVALGLGAVAGPAHGQLFHRQSCDCTPCWTSPAPAAPATTLAAPGTPAPAGETPPTVGQPSVPGTDLAAAPATPYDSGDIGGGALSTFDSAVGYIDSAIPMNIFRLRFDAAWDNNRATRAEFFYARGAPLGPGLPKPEPRDDYQEYLAYTEAKIGANVSAFIEMGIRALNPLANDNHAGLGDMYIGGKYAFRNEPDAVSTFQLKLYLPTGDADKGLGNDHVSIEPGLLCYRKLSDSLRMESELRLWVPIGGTSFAGEVLRYGVGFSYGERSQCSWWLNPVVELVGWTVLSGKETVTVVPPLLVADAAGDTIVNAKVGVRFGLGSRFDIYTGYGRALTGEVWYKDIWRTELRLAF